MSDHPPQHELGWCLQPLHTRGRDGREYMFYYRVEDDFGRTIFMVWPRPHPSAVEQFAEASFVPFDGSGGGYRLDVITNHEQEWAKRVGLSEALLFEASRRLNARIVSSRPVADDSERQSPRAQAMWRRLESNGLARFDEVMGRWVYIPPQVLGPVS